MAHKSHPNRIDAYYKKQRPVRPPVESEAVPAAQWNEPQAPEPGAAASGFVSEIARSSGCRFDLNDDGLYSV